MSEFEIEYYDSDHGGMYTLFTKSEFFIGDHADAVALVESQKSPWGFNYTVSQRPEHGKAIITPLPAGVIELREKIAQLELDMKELMANSSK